MIISEFGSYSHIHNTGEPTLRDNLKMNIIEGTTNVSIDISDSYPAFPFPMIFQWQRNGINIASNTSTVTYGYPVVNFANVSRSDTGNYSLTATNFLLDGSDEQLGNDSGSFNLNVLCKEANMN